MILSTSCFAHNLTHINVCGNVSMKMLSRLGVSLFKCRKILLRPIAAECRNKSTKPASLTKSENQVSTNVRPLGEKIKETTKTASYLGVILLGVGVTGTLIYAVFNELFSSKSPNNIYTAAVKKCLAHTKVEDKLGLPITAFGAETRRGRRQHPSYMGFLDKSGKKHIRMKFYLQGAFHKGTAHLEVVENDSGDYEYLYLLVECDDLLQTKIFIDDGHRNPAKLDADALFL